jgi:hypothetical protein
MLYIRRLFFLTIVWLVAASPNAVAATPFTAPANFDLSGSSIGFTFVLDASQTDLSSAINPNPTPVTGLVIIDTLNQASGVFSGRLSNISASSILNVPRFGSPTVTATLNSDTLSGLFIWQQDKVFFNAESLTATLTIGGQSTVVPLSGIKLPANYTDGQLSLSFQVAETFEYAGSSVSITLDVRLLGTLSQTSGDSTAPNTGSVWVQLNTDKMSYQADDTLKLFGAVGNAGASQNVDIYVALQMPDGTLLFYPNYTADVVPILSGFTLDSNAYVPPLILQDIALPSSVPPLSEPNNYQFLAAVTETNTFNFLTDIVSAPFTYGLVQQSGDAPDPNDTTPPSGNGAHDGRWTGTGGSNVVSADCPGLAYVLFDITNNLVTGVAVDAAPEDADAYDITARVEGDSLADGVLWEEFTTDLIAVGAFTGNFSGNQLSGTWYDSYGCSGTYSLTRN